MSDQDYEKLWFAQSLNQTAVARASELIQQTGRALPCKVVAVSGSFVTVEFELDAAPWSLPQITIPKAESQWIRMPTQIGDYGVTQPADAYLSQIAGEGGGLPSMARPGNLAALVWVPVASKAFSSVNVDAAYIAGPQGAVIRTEDGSAALTIDTSGITIAFGGKSIVINSSGVTIDGILWDTHDHDDPQGGVTGPPQ